jgi:malate dehydrogenase (oxaloacetate-decarboxylating)(NADP+)
MDTGVARRPIVDMNEYKERLEAMQGRSKQIMRTLINKAKACPKRIVFPEGEEEKILRAAHILIEEGIAKPILLGDIDEIKANAASVNVDLDGMVLIDPANSDQVESYTKEFFQMRQRKGVTLAEARRTMRKSRNHYGSMMVLKGDADTLLSGINHHYPETIRPALEIIGKQDNLSKVHGMYMMVTKKEATFFADTTVAIEPSAYELAETAILTAQKAQQFDFEPKVAMLSFSNFGSAVHPLTLKVKEATALVKEHAPDLVVDGEIQANVALDPDLVETQYPFSELKGNANVFIFPDLQSGNIAYKLLHKLGGAEQIGPILMGMKKPVHVLQRGDAVADIVNMAAVAVVDAQEAQAK